MTDEVKIQTSFLNVSALEDVETISIYRKCLLAHFYIETQLLCVIICQLVCHVSMAHLPLMIKNWSVPIRWYSLSSYGNRNLVSTSWPAPLWEIYISSSIAAHLTFHSLKSVEGEDFPSKINSRSRNSRKDKMAQIQTWLLPFSCRTLPNNKIVKRYDFLWWMLVLD